MSLPAVKKVLVWAAKKFPASKVSPETIDAYAEELEKLDHARLELAFKALIVKDKFWPALKDIFDAEKAVVTEVDKTRAFRQVELALIQLNDERQGDVISPGEYREQRQKILLESGITEAMLELAQVYRPGRDGYAPEPALSWGELEERRRQNLAGAAHGPKPLPSIKAAFHTELKRLTAEHGLPEPYLPKDALLKKPDPRRKPMPLQSVENIRQALSHSLTPNPELPKDIQRWLDEEQRTL